MVRTSRGDYFGITYIKSLNSGNIFSEHWFFDKKILNFDKSFSQNFHLLVIIIRNRSKYSQCNREQSYYHVLLSLFTFISIAIEVSCIKYHAFFRRFGSYCLLYCKYQIITLSPWKPFNHLLSMQLK